MKNVVKNYLIWTVITWFFLLWWFFLLLQNWNTILITNQSIINKNTTETTNTLKILKNKIQKQTAYILFKNKQYNQALIQIKWTKSEDYYNRWVIFLTEAIKKSKSNNTQELIKGENLCKKAQEQFEKADKLQTNNKLKIAIQKNKKTTEEWCTIHKIKTCFSSYETTISQIRSTKKVIKKRENIEQKISNNINKEKQRINKTEKKCYEKLKKQNNIIKTAQNTIKKNIQSEEKKQKQSYKNNLTNPKLCIYEKSKQVLNYFPQANKDIEQIIQEDKIILEILQNKDTTQLKQICQNSQSDNIKKYQSMQWIQKLIKETTKESNQTTNNQNYKNLEKESIKNVSKKNKLRINKNMQIKNNFYKPMEQINKLFKEFFWNTKDFDI